MSSISVPAHFPSHTISTIKKKTAKLTLWPLVAATFFMVSGGTYGTEEIIHGAGYGQGILILLFLPLFWSLPTAFMIGELSSALPQEGGYYAWVRRGLGNFWGFQEAWLSLAASIFDMAIYPTLFVFYLKQIAPWFGVGSHGVLAGLFVIAACAALNVAGIRVVGITSLWLFFLLSLPFALVVVMSPLKVGAFAAPHAAVAGTSLGLLGGVMVAMWNYMGWDNASTIAQEVERPQRTYPKAMIAAVILVSATYVLPFVAVYFTGIPSSTFASDGAWGTVGGLVGGQILGFEWLRFLIVLGGMMSAFGMFNALVMSYSRLPLAMAREGMLPKIFAKTSQRTNAPWVAILVCASGWALCLGLLLAIRYTPLPWSAKRWLIWLGGPKTTSRISSSAVASMARLRIVRRVRLRRRSVTATTGWPTDSPTGTLLTAPRQTQVGPDRVGARCRHRRRRPGRILVRLLAGRRRLGRGGGGEEALPPRQDVR